MRTLLKIILLISITSTIVSAKPKPVDFSMIISGGVSLGAYEAGYNWAMVKMLSSIRDKAESIRPELQSVAGASAGSINALITAIYWCQKESVPYNNSIDNNLFYETWVNLGIEDLLIKGKSQINKSTLFTRKALEKKGQNIVAHMKKSIFRKGCSVPLGISVTKAEPMIEEFAGIKIKNQHFSAPFTLKEQGGKVIVENKRMPESTDFYISIPGVEKSREKIIDVLFASSAFPGAFKQVQLDYIYNNKRYKSYFIDGGAYDNVPLQLAIELNPKANSFVFIDPSNMRKEPPSKNTDEQERRPVGFLSANGIPLLSSLEIFQSMKLYQAINKYFRHKPQNTLMLSSRYHPITGKFIEHFGAFLDKNFRIYDYHVGVYDAINHLAVELKKKNHFSSLSQVQLMDQLKENLDMKKGSESLVAYKLFRDIEYLGKSPQKNSRFGTIYHAFNKKLNDLSRYDIDNFKIFLDKLDINYLEHNNRSFIVRAKKNIDDWYKRPLRYIINRITTLENDRADVYDDYSVVATSASIAAWFGSSFVKEKDGFDLFPINAPRDEGKEWLRTLLRFVPNEFSSDMKNGGFSMAYSSYWYKDLGAISGLEAKLSYNHSENLTDFIRADLNAFKEYGDFVKFGVGASLYGDMRGDFFDSDTGLGFNAYMDFIDIFRFTYAQRHRGNIDEHYIYFGIENIPSLIYWLNR